MDQDEHRWRFLAQSVTGASHAAAELPCQDSHAVAVVGEGDAAALVACVADGAGSAPHSDQGSAIACESLLASARRHYAEAGSFAELDEPTVVAWVAEARQNVARRAEELACDPRDLATTICAAVVGPERAVFFQLGDGAMVVSRQGVHGVVFWPQSGEYANTTNFLTADKFEQKLEFAVAPGRIEELALMTDGLERLALQFDARTPHLPFFAPLFKAIVSDQDEETLAADLATFLRSPAIESRSHDDKTLVLATRN
ncbi:MAG: protein phosphatase 2C domain-containing protein [Pirellulales bacterium]|nr:protein phosphatase 2C domain-containing protein [Pirellulales bacterium]